MKCISCTFSIVLHSLAATISRSVMKAPFLRWSVLQVADY